VLGSRWSKVLGLPIALPAVGVYAAMLMLLLLPSQAVTNGRTRQRDGLLVLLAAMAVGGALWFAGLQIFALGAICRFCMTVHVTGGLAGAIILFRAVAARAASDTDGYARWGALGFAAVALMIALQIGFPSPTARVVHDDTLAASRDDAVGEYRIEIGDGEIRLQPAGLPMLGPIDADHLYLLLYDYTCPHCRKMHGFLTQARQRYGRQLGIVMLPVPLSADCNPTVERTEPIHQQACDYAALALAVWQADATKFEAFDHWLAQGQAFPTLDQAGEHARRLVGAEALTQAFNSHWPREQIARNVKLYKKLYDAMGTGGLPMLLSGGVLIAGRSNDAQELFDVFEQDMGLKPLVHP